jgi:hypothetical protein
MYSYSNYTRYNSLKLNPSDCVLYMLHNTCRGEVWNAISERREMP